MMTDVMSKEDRSKTMRAIKSVSQLENSVSKSLWARGLRFRRNSKNLPGKPDISIKKHKIVIFIDSCFWHGCEVHCQIPKTNKEYWIPKISKNIVRDIKINQHYQSLKWNLLRVWEHQLKNEYEKTIEQIASFILDAKNQIKNSNRK